MHPSNDPTQSVSSADLAPRAPEPPAPIKHAMGTAPDDGGAGPGSFGAAGGGAPPADDGNFKRGRFKPAAIGVGLLIVAGGGFALWRGMKSEQAVMSADQIGKEKKDIFVLPKGDALSRWKKWASQSDAPYELRAEALTQLAYAEDEQIVSLATDALKGDKRVAGTAAQVLAFLGSPKADSAKGALLEALKTADESNRPQIVWALVALKEPQAFKAAMEEFRKGHLATVERLGGGKAYDAELLAGLVSLDELAKMADDESAGVRQMVATALSRNAEPKFTDTLVKLVRDKDPEVGREAANGLGKIADEKAKPALIEALGKADKESRTKFLEALRNGIGGEGLVLALDSVTSEKPETVWFQYRQVFDMLEWLADPRAGDALVKWVEAKPRPVHWVGEVGLRLAEIGDVRAAKYIGLRMKSEPGELYKLENFWEADEGGHLSRTDLPRVKGSRMLADLAVIQPGSHDKLKADAEDAVLAWIKSRPQPHANGLRFLAAVQSQKALEPLRDWAFPKDPLPKEGQQPPFPTAFETAQSALRYVGYAKDEASFQKLLDQLKRKKEKKMNITQAGLEGAGLAMLGMSLRAVAVGASEGLAHLGKVDACKPLMEFIEDETWHEEARFAAATALAWSADDKVMAEVVKKVKEFSAKKDPLKQLIASMYASTLTLHPTPSAVPELVELLKPEVELGLRISAARAIGVTGFDAAVEAKLFEKMTKDDLRNQAALAILMGGTPEAAARAMALYADVAPEAIDDLKDHYYRAFGFWSDADFKRGALYRYVANAVAISRMKIRDVPQDWAKQRLGSQFDNLKFDNGPHSETRVVLRYRLREAAKSNDAAVRKGAIMTLQFMKEQGTLMALRYEKGETGELARKAFFELLNPKFVQAEDLSKFAPKGGKDTVNVNLK